MGTSPNVARPFLVKSRHPDRISEDPIEDVNIHTYEKFLQTGQDTVESATIPIDPFLLPSSAQSNSIFLGVNPDDLDESQASLEKRMEEKTKISHHGNTTKEDDGDMDHNISKDNYDLEFPSTQKLISTPFSRPISLLQIDVSTPLPIQQKPLASCSSNIRYPFVQRILLPSQVPNSARSKVDPNTNSKCKRGLRKKKKSISAILIDSDSKNEKSSRRRCPNSTLSMVEALVQVKAIDKAMHKHELELQKKDNERRAIIFERSEKDAVRRYEQIMAEIEERKFVLKFNLL